jgi:hypothetical protein
MTTPLIKENGILTEGKVQYISLHLPDSSVLTIINVYVPRASMDRACLWKRISEVEFTIDHVIIGEDLTTWKKSIVEAGWGKEGCTGGRLPPGTT